MAEVYAVGVSANTGGPTSRYSADAGKRIEAAMSKAVEKCFAAGITDPDAMRRIMMAAREEVKKQLDAEPVTSQGNEGAQ